MTTKPNPAVLYPDVAAKGSLAAALRAVAAEQGLSFSTAGPASDSLRVAVVPSATPHRDDLVVNAWRLERKWSVTGSGQGRTFITGNTQNLAEVAQVAQAWSDGLPLADIQQVAPFVELTGHFEVPEQDPDQVLASEWQYMRKDAQAANWPEYRALIEVAYAEPKLRELYPYTSHWSLHFSTDIGHRDSKGPHVNASRGGRYQVVSPRRVLIGETETSEEAVALVLSWMPEEAGPAVSGANSKKIHDPLWVEVERHCDPERSGVSPRFWIRNTSVNDWQSLFDLVSGESWPWRYVEGDVERVLPAAAEVFARPADAPPVTLWVSKYGGRLLVTFRPTSPTEIAFNIDLRALQGEWQTEGLLEYLDELRLRVRFEGPVLMAPEDSPTHPVLAFHPLRDASVSLLSRVRAPDQSMIYFWPSGRHLPWASSHE